MNIGIVGSGNVGGTLGKRWARNGHHVVFSSRNPQSEEMKALVGEAGSSARAASVAEAAQASEAILFATPWPGAKGAIESAGDLTGKIVIDAMNPLQGDLSGRTVGATTSAGEQVQQWAPGAKVVKAFNTVGYNVMANPVFDGRRAVMLYCGNDNGAKRAVHQLEEELDFDPLDLGPISGARLLEHFALLWITLAFKPGHGRDFAFQKIARP